MAGYQPRHDTDPVWFNGTKINHLDITSTGVGVRVTGVFGWDDRPDVRDVRELRSGQDGEYADNLFIGGRTITLEGEVYGSSWVNLQSRKRTLAALFIPSTDEVLLKIPDPATASPTTSYSTTGMTGYERVSCRVIEGIQFGDTLDPMCQTWQVVLRASDPRVYSDTETSTDSGTSGTAARTVTVDQGGTYETPIELEVTGPTSASWSITEPTSELSISSDSLALAASEVVSINVQDRTATLTAGYENQRLFKSSLVALWMLDETSGTTADNAEGTAAYDGTYAGTYTLNQSGPVTGIVAVDFNGSSGRITGTFDAALSPASMTCEAWIRLDALPVLYATIYHVSGPGAEFILRVNSSGVVNAGTTNGRVSNTVLSTATWYHIVATRSAQGGLCKIYIDGVDDAAVNLGGAVANGANSFQIGRDTTASCYLDGKISAVAVYNKEFSAAEVAELYEMRDATASVGSAYQYLDARTLQWANLGTASSTYTLASSGLNTGSKLNVAYRDARL